MKYGGTVMYTFKQRTTKKQHCEPYMFVYSLPESVLKSGKTMIVSCIFCKYVVQICV